METTSRVKFSIMGEEFVSCSKKCKKVTKFAYMLRQKNENEILCAFESMLRKKAFKKQKSKIVRALAKTAEYLEHEQLHDWILEPKDHNDWKACILISRNMDLQVPFSYCCLSRYVCSKFVRICQCYHGSLHHEAYHNGNGFGFEFLDPAWWQ